MDWQKNEKIFPELAGELASLRAQNGGGLTAFRNRAFTNRVNATAVTAGAPSAIAAVLIQARASGIFQFSFGFAYSNATAATSNAITISSASAATPITLSNVNPVDGYPGTGTNPMVSGGSPGIYTNNNAAGITQAGGTPGTSPLSWAFTTATGQTSGIVQWAGNINNSTDGSGSPYAIGTFIALFINVNSLTTNWAISNMAIAINELPS